MSARLYPGPNAEVLEAQARVCTGPYQSRPLGEKPADPQPGRILELILQSARGELPWKQRVSEAQMGAFFAAMTIRKEFGEETNWSAAEREAFAHYGVDLERSLPAEVRFLMYPERGCRAANPQEERVVKALEKILAGQHLSYEETRRIGEAILHGQVREALKAATLIGQRMNRESYDEICGCLDAALPPEEILPVAVESLAHLGQSFDGSTRYFRPTLFVAAVRAALSQASVLYGVDAMPPKRGVTEEQILNALGARTDLSRQQAAVLIEDPEVGFAYLSQREYALAVYRLRELRVHIKKRPVWATTEKAQQLFSSAGANYMVVGYTHPGYEGPLLQLMWERGFRAGLTVKGEEGTSHYSLRLGQPSAKERKAVNYTQGFRRIDGRREDFALDADPRGFGLEYAHNPRLEPVSAEAFARAGIAALSGEPGHVYDRIVLNAALIDHYLGICPDPHTALERARQAVDSGCALAHLSAYIERSKQWRRQGSTSSAGTMRSP